MLYDRRVVSSKKFRAHIAFTDRVGGYSDFPYSSLNMGMFVGDQPARVKANHAIVSAALGVSAEALYFTQQVHGTEIAYPEGKTVSSLPVADAQITTIPEAVLAVVVADCTPVLLADVETGIVAAAHAGRRGMHSGLVPQVMESMYHLGAKRIQAVIGPAICPRCYEVEYDIREEVAQSNPSAYSVTHSGTPSLDISGAVAAQIRTTGGEILFWSQTCTYESSRLYSYRRDGDTGRFAGLVWLSV